MFCITLTTKQMFFKTGKPRAKTLGRSNDSQLYYTAREHYKKCHEAAAYEKILSDI